MFPNSGCPRNPDAGDKDDRFYHSAAQPQPKPLLRITRINAEKSNLPLISTDTTDPKIETD